MTDAIPQAARDILRSGVLCYMSVRTARGPHLTPVVYVLDGGRLWVTTSRSSLKARIWRKDRHVAGLVEDGGRVVTFRGSVRVYDGLDPLSWPSAVLAGPRLLRAAARFTMKNARFFAGYAVDASRVPLAWSPPGRVFAAIDVEGGRVLDDDGGNVLDAWGRWPADVDYSESFSPPGRQPQIHRSVPAGVLDAARSATFGALALQGPLLTVLPVRPRWSRRSPRYEAILPRSFADLAFVDSEFRAAVTVGYASTWRAAEMRGMLFQGKGRLFALDGVRKGRDALRRRVQGYGKRETPQDLALALLRPSRVVWWDGWTSGSAERNTT
ncbi:MAG TPA: pyridoxamine 5'-phosphate oxidase family protein [Actinomycetota bacterium]|nr:pyridoxamine 5'-phosphate oxidase family protein [Actinomycetota bacterium]